jgi:hypothetical protein
MIIETKPSRMQATQGETSNASGEDFAFSKWREVNINDDDYTRGDADAAAKIETEHDDGEDPALQFRMFGEEDEEDVFEEVRYDYATPTADATTSASTTAVVIRHHAAYPNSTGLAVWSGSEILARFLCDQQRLSGTSGDTTASVANVRQKKVLEVGAGAGLPGIVAHKVLGAERVLVTDGDYDALNNLQTNVDANRKPILENASDNEGFHHNETSGTIECLQLIWGKAVGAFLEEHGKQDVVLAADCVYMVPSLKPLWATIDSLLDDDGIFVYAQTAASAVPWKDFSERVEFHGFETILEVAGEDLEKYYVDKGDDSDNENECHREDEEYELGIYVFRRRR